MLAFMLCSYLENLTPETLAVGSYETTLCQVHKITVQTKNLLSFSENCIVISRMDKMHHKIIHLLPNILKRNRKIVHDK